MEERSSLTGHGLAVPQVQKAAGCPEGSPAPCPSLPTQLFPTPDPNCDAFRRKWRVIHKLTTLRQRQTGDSGALKHYPPFSSSIGCVLDDHLALRVYGYSYICHLEMQEAICIKIPTQRLPFSVPLRDINVYFSPLMYK